MPTRPYGDLQDGVGWMKPWQRFWLAISIVVVGGWLSFALFEARLMGTSVFVFLASCTVGWYIKEPYEEG
jgi:hypothetical protein